MVEDGTAAAARTTVTTIASGGAGMPKPSRIPASATPAAVACPVVADVASRQGKHSLVVNASPETAKSAVTARLTIRGAKMPNRAVCPVCAVATGVIDDRAGNQAQDSIGSVVDGSAKATAGGSRIAGDDAVAQHHGTEVAKTSAIGIAAVLNGEARNIARHTTFQFEHAGTMNAVHRKTRRTWTGDVHAVGDKQGTARQRDRSAGGKRDGVARLRTGDGLPQSARTAAR